MSNGNNLTKPDEMAPENLSNEISNSHASTDSSGIISKVEAENTSSLQPELESLKNDVVQMHDTKQLTEAINKNEMYEKENTDDTLIDFISLEMKNRKRKNDLPTEETSDTKKLANISSDEKKIVNLRKNIRDVMDENQLDTDTLAAQREESERLARVAEQQKIIREYQRQTAVNRQFVRTQNRVLSLLKSGNTYAKPAEISEAKSLNEVPEKYDISEIRDTSSESVCNDSKVSNEELSDTTESDLKCYQKPSPNKPITISSTNEQLSSDIVTIEDSSSEDDCIMLSDDDEDLVDEPDDDPNNSGLHVKDTYNVPDEHGRVVVNIGHPEGEDDIFIAPQIAKTIKPHQIGGVRFLFDNVIESTKRFKHSSGFGCILAHSMGLGKTLQVICFCDIFLRHTPSKNVLCVMPINTLQNWVSEFNMWMPKESQDPQLVQPREFDVFVLNDQHKTLSARAKVVLKWAEQGGVLLIGYELFRLLALKLLPTRKRRGKNISSQNATTEANARLMESMHQALVKPGPDLVICDEGHRIKNAHAGISLALKQIRTRRRIVLTGYPLQNNLLEYWCMVDFVRPNYLGTRTEFCNMFERPIQNGQCIDSTPEDIKLMRYRAHVLHSLLVGFVQRRSHMVLQQTLPQKLEYVILTRMTEFQRQLYQIFMNDVVRSKAVPNPLKAFAVCCKIWNHPDVLYNFLKKRETDLDLEIEDSEVVSETPSIPQTDNTHNFISNANVDACVTGEETQHNIKLEYNQLKTSATPILASAPNLSSNVVKNSSDLNPGENQLNLTNSTKDQSYNNMYYPTNYYQHTSDMSFPSNCDENNYWQEPTTPYFFYHSLPSSVGCPAKPDYVGQMDKDASEKLKNGSDAITSSSEIVDLDTKEIKTIETDIDMTRNPVIKNYILQEQSSAQNIVENESLPCKVTDDVKGGVNLKSTSPTVGSEKESPPKVRSDDGTPYDWGIELMKKYEPGLIANSSKMEIFFCILNESIKLGDRVLLFSQSLLTLNLIETFLQSNIVPGCNVYWTRNATYFRLDGSTTSQEREKLVNEFNSNTNVKLFLISTRAGSLGINLVGANRVIVFDASWNPCHDTQAVYRIYRYGQKKSCFIYRIVMDKCLEKKIYDRQIKKQGMSDRVVDECNPDAHLSMKDVTNLCHDYDDTDVDGINNNSSSFTQALESYEDNVIQKIVEHHKDCLSKEPFHHESLLIDRKEKKLSQAEKRQAHRGYEMEKKASIKQTSMTSINKIQYRIVRNDGTVTNRPVASIRPMQTTKTQSANKSIRSTRWIPAEVWQRQGMTAQEMTLPLDVVIPTNSNDKSNIVLRAGQRVMVLKSAKGIYMQLESGKIIAIRTSNKLTEGNKMDKGEVIDITSEGDTTSEDRIDTMKITSPTTKTLPARNSGLKLENVEHINENNKKSSQVIHSNANSIIKTKSEWRKNKLSQGDSFEETEPQLQKAEASSDHLIKMKGDNFSEDFNQKAVHSLPSKPYSKQFVKTLKTKPLNKDGEPSLAMQKDEFGYHPTLNEQIINKSLQKHSHLKSSTGDINNLAIFSRQENEIKKPYLKPAHNSIKNFNNPFISRKVKIDGNINPDTKAYNPSLLMPLQKENPISQPTETFGVKTIDSNIAAIKTDEVKSNCYVQHINNKQLENNTAKSSKCSYPPSRKGGSKSTPETFQNSFMDGSDKGKESKAHTTISASAGEYLPVISPIIKQDQSHRTDTAATSQQSFLQQQPHSKLHLHAPHYNMQHTQYNNPVTPLQMGVVQCINPANNLVSNTLFPSREGNNYYENIYNSNNMTPCEYSAQHSDYTALGSYNHSQYHSHLHTNSYGSASSASIGSNPYNLHWSPLVTPLSDQYNAVYSTTYTQNGAQSNQWCNP